MKIKKMWDGKINVEILRWNWKTDKSQSGLVDKTEK